MIIADSRQDPAVSATSDVFSNDLGARGIQIFVAAGDLGAEGNTVQVALIAISPDAELEMEPPRVPPSWGLVHSFSGAPAGETTIFTLYPGLSGGLGVTDGVLPAQFEFEVTNDDESPVAVYVTAALLP